MKFKFLLVMAALLVTPAIAEAAGAISAIVEKTVGAAGSVHQMDLLAEGQVIKLPKKARIVLGYPQSCVREIITGGTVTIGARKSRVANGVLKTEKVSCHAGKIVRAETRQAGEVAGAVFRKGNFKRKPLPKADWVLYGVSPVIRLSKRAKTIRIERLDKVEDTLKIPVNGEWVDLAAAGIRLEPSGTYAVSIGSRPYIIKVSPRAQPGAPMLSRLIVM